LLTFRVRVRVRVRARVRVKLNFTNKGILIKNRIYIYALPPPRGYG